MDNLPENVTVEILSRLPVKTLLCLKSVCKSWKSHISDPRFVNMHLLHSMTNPNDNDCFIAHHMQGKRHKLSLINMNMPRRVISLNLPFPPPASMSCDDNFRVVGSCNGLLCLAYQSKRQILPRKLYLWNPATRQVRKIGNYDIKISKNKNDIYYFCLGFGFDLVSGDYKVVRILTNWSHWESQVEVYSLKENSWKEVEAEYLKFNVINSGAAILKGSPCWMIEDNLVPQRFALVSFHVQSEKFCTTSLPDGIMCCDIFEFKESLAILSVSDDLQDISIWTLDNDENCWIKKFALMDPSLEIANNIYIAGCLKTGEFVGQTESSNKLVIYDINTNEVRRPSGRLKLFNLRRTYNYSESLVNLNDPIECLPQKG